MATTTRPPAPIISNDVDDRADGTERKCGGCNFWYDLAVEGIDYKDPLAADPIRLCGICQGEAADEAEKMVTLLAPLVRIRPRKD